MKGAGANRNEVRLIAGRWRSRRVQFLDGEGLRPTPDRVRETVFNWLQGEVPGARCLDAFAGSGALGLEALSRGAESCLLIERSPAQARQLEQEARKLGAEGAQVVCGDALALLSGPVGPFDLVFLDPPFGKDLVAPILACLLERQLLSPSALVYVEAEAALADLGAGAAWEILRHRQAGAVHYHLVQRAVTETT